METTITTPTPELRAHDVNSLEDTVSFMLSSDWKDRMKGEYYQLVLRIKGLRAMLAKHHDGKLDFTPNSPINELEYQLRIMESYRRILELRAAADDIKFDWRVL